MYPTGFRHASGEYRVRPVISIESFHYLLGASGMSQNPEYVKAVIRSYIEVKQARGRTPQQIGYKLGLLERDLPQHAQSFIAVRAEKRLPRSRVVGDGNPYALARASTHVQTSGPSLQEQYILSPNNRHPHRAASSASIRTTRTTPAAAPSPSRTASTYRPAPQAVNPEDSEEPPPPPYASQDPEPEATRELQIRLAAEAQAEGRLNLPEAGAVGRSEDGSASASGSGQGDSSSNRQGQTTPTIVHAPPPGPPPTSTLQRNESRRSEHQPSTPPTDPEEARIWEESQLEEAVRLSNAAERERLELEEAMRLSLAESEAEASRSATNNEFGPNHTMPAVFEEDGYDSSEPSSRRMSSYNPASQLEGNHRRAVSDVYAHSPRPNVESVKTGMDHLTIPDTWQAGGNSQGGGQGSSNLMDDDFGSTDFKQPTLAPQRTGAVMQSNNPFLSPGERDEGSSSGFLQPQQAAQSQYPASQSSPGDKRLPTIPGSEATSPTSYDPPSGPPPQFSVQPNSDSKYLPPLPPRQPTIPMNGSPSSPGQGSSPQARRLPPRPISSQGPALPQRNISSSIYSASNPPTSSFPGHSPAPPSPSFFPPQPPSGSSPSFAAMHQAVSAQHGGEDPLETLRDFHTVFMVDDSSSMAGERWSQAREALMGVAETAARYDEQGVDIYFINSKRVGKELRAAADVEDLFAGLEPRGTTPTGLRLEVILREYMTRLERSQISSPNEYGPGQSDFVKPLNLIVVTDGVFAHPIIARVRAINVNPALDRNQLLGIAPVDDPESVIIACAMRLDKGEFPLSQVGIQFLQVGNDSDAREALQELDDNLAEAHGVRDMVDTIPFNGGGMSTDLITKTLLGGINRRLDRRS